MQRKIFINIFKNNSSDYAACFLVRFISITDLKTHKNRIYEMTGNMKTV